MTFKRSDEYLANITIDALDRDVHIDSIIEIKSINGKLKAYCKETNTFLQFPRAIRKLGKKFIADIIKASTEGKVFYRTYHGSIREYDNNIEGNVIA